MIIHKNIRFLRKSRRYSQTDLAQELGLNRGNIASYETGTNPTLEVLVKMVKLFGVPADMLLGVDLEAMFNDGEASDIKDIIPEGDIYGRLSDFISMSGKSMHDFAKLLDVDEKLLLHLLEHRSAPEVLVLSRIFTRYPWLNANWLFKGKGSIGGARGYDASENSGDFAFISDPEMHDYKVSASAIEGLKTALRDLTTRIETLEKEAAKKSKKK